MTQNNKLLKIISLFFILISLISCSSKDEKNIITQIESNNFVDLSIYCKSFDTIIIYDEGYYSSFDKNQWPGTKIYYLSNGNIKKTINLHYCADIPFGTVIHFSNYDNGMIKRSTENSIFYLSNIFEYKSGKILQLSLQKTDIHTISFK